MSTSDHTGSGAVSGEKPWHRDGATLYTLKDAERRYPGLPDQVNDNWLHVQGPDAEAVAERIHAALAAQPTPVCASVEGVEASKSWIDYDQISAAYKIWQGARSSAEILPGPAFEGGYLAGYRAAPRSDQPLTRASDAGGELENLARLKAVSLSAANYFKLDSGLYSAMITAENAFCNAAVAYVRKLLSASSPPAVAGGADREAIAAAWELLLACEADCSTDDIANGMIDESDADDAPVGHSLGEGRAPPIPTYLQFGHMRRLRKALLALTARPASPGAQALERVRHVKRGTECEVLGEAEGQVSAGFYRQPREEGEDRICRLVGDDIKLVVYRELASGKLWYRFPDEFHDGRFVTVSPGAQAQRPDLGADVGWASIERDEKRIADFIVDRFGLNSLNNPMERADRLLEEAIEVQQAIYHAVGMESDGERKAVRLAHHVYGKEPGDPLQEMGGVMTCALALGRLLRIRLDHAAQAELTRIEGLSKAHFDARHQAKVDAGVAAQHDRPVPALRTLQPTDAPTLEP